MPGIAAIFTAADVPGDNRFGADRPRRRAARIAGMPVRRSADRRSGGRNSRGALGRRGGPSGSSSRLCRPFCRSIRRSPPASFWASRGESPGATCTAALARAEHLIEGSLRTGGQEHFYLETQAALAIPGENGSISVYSSTQNPSEIQAMVAHCLGLRQNQVVCIATRMGGAFGGKESQAAHPALLASLVAAQDRPAGPPGLPAKPRHADRRASGIPTSRDIGPASSPTGGSRPSRSSCTPTAGLPATFHWP